MPYFGPNSKVVIQKFQNYIREEQLLQKNEKVLLAVSGGVDSMVMSHLFAMAKMDFGIAHCNFQLRRNDSDEDAEFVKKVERKYLTGKLGKLLDTLSSF